MHRIRGLVKQRPRKQQEPAAFDGLGLPQLRSDYFPEAERFTRIQPQRPNYNAFRLTEMLESNISEIHFEVVPEKNAGK